MMYKKLKAQASMIEYIVMTLFMMIIIMMVVFMFLGIQFMGIGSEASQEKDYRSMALLKALSKTHIFTKDNTMTENPVFYDKKLTAATQPGLCKELEKLFGSGWSMEINVIDGTADPDKWEICGGKTGKSTIREVPINVYRELTDSTEAALMRVSVYV